MSDLSKNTIFPPQLATLLSKEGFHSIYSIVTYFPYKIIHIVPEHFNKQDSLSHITYILVEGKILSYKKKYGKRPYFVLTIESQYSTYTVKYYRVSSFSTRIITRLTYIQCFLTKTKGEYTAIKIAELRKKIDRSICVLGSAIIKEYWDTVYEKKGELEPYHWKRIFSRLPTHAFELSLAGLIPTNNIIPETLSLYDIHIPESFQTYAHTKKMWTLLQAFLQRSVLESWYIQRSQYKAKKSHYNIAFLKYLDSVTPFSLSLSQKNAIWELVTNMDTPH